MRDRTVFEMRKSRLLLVSMLVFAVILFAPMVSAKSFIIQDNAGNPVIIANGTTNNVGIGVFNPSSQLVVDGNSVFQGNISLSSNDITNLDQLFGYYGAACGAGEVVQDINDDGTFVCANVTTEVQDRWVDENGDTMRGNLNMNNYNITGLRNLTNFFANACGAGQVVQQVYDDGSYQCVDVSSIAGDTDDQNLSEVLVHGAVANRSIDMSSNSLQNVGNAFVDSLFLTNALNDGNISDTLTITGGSVDTSVLSGTVTNNINTGFFTTSNPLADGNISQTITISSGGSVDPGALTRMLQDAEVTAALTINESGFVNSSALESRISGTGLSLSSGVLSVLYGGTTGTAVEGDTQVTLNADQGVSGGSTITLGDGGSFNVDVGAYTGLTRNGTGLSIDTSVVPQKTVDETLSGSWAFQNDLTVQGNLDVWGNITNTDVSNLSINGSLLPPEGYSNTFDVGSSSRQWRNGYFSGTVDSNTLLQGGTQVIDTINAGSTLTFTSGDGNGPTVNLGVASGGITSTELGSNAVTNVKIADGAVTNTKIANAAVNKTQLAQSGCSTNDILHWDGSSWECTTDDSGTDTQDLGTSGNQITLTNSPSIYAPFANNSDKLDGVELANINWGDVAMAQSDIDVSDLGAADADLNMNNFDITTAQSIDFGSTATNISASATGGSTSALYIGNQRITTEGIDSVNDADSDPANEIQNLSEVLVHGNTANMSINMDSNNLNNVNQIDNGGSAVNVADDVDLQGNSLTSSGGEMCIGDMCS